MDIESILGFVGNKNIFERGLSYYQASLVNNFRRQGNIIEASVTDSRLKPYRVQITLDDSDRPRYAFCNCPYARGVNKCKHIAAVLIHDLENHRVIENPILATKEAEGPPLIIKLDKIKNTEEEGVDIIDSLRPQKELLKKKKRGERFRLVFIIEFYSDYRGTRWVLYPACQYRKLNGEPGRIEKYDFTKVTEKYTAHEKILLNKLLSGENEKDKLKNHLDFLIKSNLPHLYLKIKSRYIQASIEKIKTVKVKFLLDRAEGNTLFFVPEIDFFGEKGNTITGIASPSNIIMSGFSMLIVNDDGKIFFSNRNELLYNLLELLFYKRDFFISHEIKQLRDFFSSTTSNITVDFDADTIKIKRLLPKPFIEIEEKYSWIYIELFFNYGEREVSFNAEGDFIFENIHGDEYTVILRNHEYEHNIFTFFSSKFRSFIHEDYYSNFFRTRASSIEFLTEHGREILDEEIEIRLKGEKRRISGQGGRIALTVHSGIDWFDINIEHIDTYGSKNHIELDYSLLASGLIKAGDTYTIITKQDIEKLQNLLEEGMSKQGKVKVSKYNFQFIDTFYNDIVNKQDSQVQTVQKICSQLKNFNRIQHYELPRKFHGTLRDYQYAGYNWLFFLHDYKLNGCLADDMGLGKTVQTLAFLQELKERKQIVPTLIVVPVNTVINWEYEIRKFTPRLNYTLHYGPNRIKEEDALKKYDLIITSYHTLRMDIELFNKINYRNVILDESQFIKNSNSLIFKTVRLLQSENRLSLTGTPIENNTFELWSQMEFLNPGLLGSKREFKKKFAKPIEIDKSEKATEKLKQVIFPFILRRKKEDVLKELPPKSEIVLYSEMDAKQSGIYTQYRDHYRSQIQGKIEKDGIEKSAIEIFAALLKLRQIALFPRLADQRYKNIKSCKFEQLKSIVEEILQEKHKILIFSQFVKSLAIIKEYFEKEGFQFSYIDGSVSAGKRMKQIRNFQKKEGVDLFLLSLKAGGTGINLTSADYVILFDPWWNPAVESQAIDRTHRIGQTQKVIAYKMIVKATVEEKILMLQEKKKKLVREIITADSSFFKSLTKKDIINLF